MKFPIIKCNATLATIGLGTALCALTFAEPVSAGNLNNGKSQISSGFSGAAASLEKSNDVETQRRLRRGYYRGGPRRFNRGRYYRGGRYYRDRRRDRTGAFIGGAIAGAIIGGAIANSRNRDDRLAFSDAHHEWCFDRYRSYRTSDGTFQPYNGPRRLCDSPYL